MSIQVMNSEQEGPLLEELQVTPDQVQAKLSDHPPQGRAGTGCPTLSSTGRYI